MKLCSSCGTWHVQSPIPENCSSCGTKLHSMPVSVPSGEPVWPYVDGHGQSIPGAIRTITRYSE